MIGESGYYPAGAQYDKSAPYNQEYEEEYDITEGFAVVSFPDSIIEDDKLYSTIEEAENEMNALRMLYDREDCEYIAVYSAYEYDTIIELEKELKRITL